MNDKSAADLSVCRSLLQQGQLSYKASGVDIVAGDTLVNRIKHIAALTTRNGVLSSIGGFGGLFHTKAAGYKDPVLVSGTDGVGTKLKVNIYLVIWYTFTGVLHLHASSIFRVKE
jgi:phosphoribosylaminoimidazole (AIR) synthetase